MCKNILLLYNFSFKAKLNCTRYVAESYSLKYKHELKGNSKMPAEKAYIVKRFIESASIEIKYANCWR